MNFQISGLCGDQFNYLFGADSKLLAQHGVERITVEEKPGYPCRISLRDVDIGRPVLLLNYQHQPAFSPYRSGHAIFVEEWALEAKLGRNEVPNVLRTRFLSLRSFDDTGYMIDADVIEGEKIESLIDRLLLADSVSYLQLHNAKRGCYLARADRVAG